MKSSLFSLSEKLKIEFKNEGRIFLSSKQGGKFFVKDSLPIIQISSNLDPYIFIHEYCHFQQWKDGCLNFNKSLVESIQSQDLKEFRQVMAIEINCEKRVLQLLKQNKINSKEHVKRINTHLYLAHELFKGNEIDFMKKRRIFDNAKDFILSNQDYIYNPENLIY